MSFGIAAKFAGIALVCYARTISLLAVNEFTDRLDAHCRWRNNRAFRSGWNGLRTAARARDDCVMSDKCTRPKVIANFAISWDGKISSYTGSPSNFSSPEDKQRLIRIRSEGDAVLVSGRTVAADSMTMGIPDATLRGERLARGQGEYPLRVVVSASGNLNPELKVFRAQFSTLIVFTSERMPLRVREALGKSCTLQIAPEADTLDLGWVLETLKSNYGVSTLVVEGGGELLRGFLNAELVDEICLTVCPLVFGSSGAVSLVGARPPHLGESTKLSLISSETIGGELFSRWRCL